MQAENQNCIESVPFHRNRKEAFAYTGFVLPPINATAVRRSIVFDRSGRLRVERSAGGIAAYFLTDSRTRRVAAWSSHAGVEGVYYTAVDDRVVVSNRPLLCHLIALERERPRCSMRWASRALLGPTLWNDCPFDETKPLPPRTALVVEDGIRFAPHPLPLSHRFDAYEPAAASALLDTSLDAVSVLARWPRGELQLSGGKDSRFAALLVAHRGIPVDVVTHARAGAGESEAASAVARALGLDHRIIAGADISTGSELIPTIRSNLQRSDGLIGEARQLAYRLAGEARVPLIQGQAHHPRGGCRIRLTAGRESIEQQLFDQDLGDSDFVMDDLAAERRSRLAEILAGYEVAHRYELAYWFYNDWRMTRWATAAYSSHARTRPVVWPMMDERVLQVVAGLSPLDRQREVSFFTALHRLSPALARVPLYEDTWRFDQGELGPREFAEDFALRTTPFREKGQGRTSERKIETIQPLFVEVLRQTSAGRELVRLMRSDVLRVLCEEPDPAASLGRPHMQVINFMWRATAVALVLEGSWF